MSNAKRSRRKFTATFKAEVAIEALKERETLSELAIRYDLHPNQISQWKLEFLEKSASVFSTKKENAQEDQVDADQLYSKIGKLEVENDFLKKSLKKLGRL
jgi:transposase-like protein